jgi:hypothetical protein
VTSPRSEEFDEGRLASNTGIEGLAIEFRGG